MKKLLIAVLLAIQVISFSYISPESNFLPDGTISLALYHPGWGINIGLFDFMEAGFSLIEGGGYIKIGSNSLNGMPLSVAAGYSKFIDISGNAFVCTDYNFDPARLGIGITYSEYNEYNPSSGQVQRYKSFAFFGRGSYIAAKNNIIESQLHLEGGIRTYTNFIPYEYNAAFWTTERFFLKFLWFDYVDLKGGISITNKFDIPFNIYNCLSVILGVYSSWVLY